MYTVYTRLEKTHIQVKYSVWEAVTPVANENSSSCVVYEVVSLTCMHIKVYLIGREMITVVPNTM